MNHNEKPSVLMDELPYSVDDAKMRSDGKTIYYIESALYDLEWHVNVELN
jgi:hypothetical protein